MRRRCVTAPRPAFFKGGALSKCRMIRPGSRLVSCFLTPYSASGGRYSILSHSLKSYKGAGLFAAESVSFFTMGCAFHGFPVKSFSLPGCCGAAGGVAGGECLCRRFMKCVCVPIRNQLRPVPVYGWRKKSRMRSGSQPLNQAVQGASRRASARQEGSWRRPIRRRSSSSTSAAEKKSP